MSINPHVSPIRAEGAQDLRKLEESGGNSRHKFRLRPGLKPCLEPCPKARLKACLEARLEPNQSHWVRYAG